MSGPVLRAVAILGTLTPIALVAGPASAVGQGSYTTITTPSATTIYHFDGTPSATNDLPVSGQASLDVATVDIDCIYLTQGGVNSTPLATTVPVTGGSFSVTAQINVFPANCRLRAIPNGVDPNTDYLASYSGPLLYANALIPELSGPTQVGFTAAAGQGTGVGAMEDAGRCGVAQLATIATPAMLVEGPGLSFCGFALPSANVTPSGTPSASTTLVDTHSAYLPAAVESFLIGDQSLAVTQTTLTTTFARHSNGDITVTESAPLVRCSADDTYPPTVTSCPSLVDTGVTFARRTDFFRGAHQFRLRDSFRSTDGHSHNVATQYISQMPAQATGTVGYRIPGHGSAYVTPTPGQVVTGLGTRAATVLVRSDVRAVEGDLQSNTMGLTWSRAPSKLQFSTSNVHTFAMPYSMGVPANGTSYVGFAVSEGYLTSTASSLAALAVKEMVVPPTITSPKAGAVIHGHLTTVKGAVSLGANGLPTSVTVNGHTAKLTKVSATKDTYVVSFNETFAKHTLTVTAHDLAGNTASASRTVTNKP